MLLLAHRDTNTQTHTRRLRTSDPVLHCAVTLPSSPQHSVLYTASNDCLKDRTVPNAKHNETACLSTLQSRVPCPKTLSTVSAVFECAYNTDKCAQTHTKPTLEAVTKRNVTANDCPPLCFCQVNTKTPGHQTQTHTHAYT